MTARRAADQGEPRVQVERAIHAVAAGEVLFGADVAARAIAFFSESTGDRRANPFPGLTDRENEVLDLVARGLDNGTIAQRLFLTPGSVRVALASLPPSDGSSSPQVAGAMLGATDREDHHGS